MHSISVVTGYNYCLTVRVCKLSSAARQKDSETGFEDAFCRECVCALNLQTVCVIVYAAADYKTHDVTTTGDDVIGIGGDAVDDNSR